MIFSQCGGTGLPWSVIIPRLRVPDVFHLSLTSSTVCKELQHPDLIREFWQEKRKLGWPCQFCGAVFAGRVSCILHELNQHLGSLDNDQALRAQATWEAKWDSALRLFRYSQELGPAVSTDVRDSSRGAVRDAVRDDVEHTDSSHQVHVHHHLPLPLLRPSAGNHATPNPQLQPPGARNYERHPVSEIMNANFKNSVSEIMNALIETNLKC